MRRLNNPNHARYLTFSTYRRLDIFTTDALRDAFADQLRLTRERHEFMLYAWVLMPNHAHLLLREPAQGRVSDILKTLKLGLSKRLITRWREHDTRNTDRLTDAQGKTHLWQRGGGYDRNIISEEEFREKVDYIHMNPVRAGLVLKPLDWAWGSARWWGGDRMGQIECDQPSGRRPA